MVMQRWTPRTPRTWSPFDEMDRLANEGFAGWPFRMMWRRLPTEDVCWAPAVEMYEKDDHFIIRAELPGMKKEDIDISVTGDTLTIKGERQASEEVSDEDYYRCEMCYGDFSRAITMPAAGDPKKIDASYEDGILEVKVLKAEEAKPKKIQIKAK